MVLKGVKTSKHTNGRGSQMPVIMLEDLCLMYFDSETILYTVNPTSDANRLAIFFASLESLYYPLICITQFHISCFLEMNRIL